MNKQLLRVVVFLLVPCLLMDPVTAAGLPSVPCSPSISYRFQEEALEVRSLWQQQILGFFKGPWDAWQLFLQPAGPGFGWFASESNQDTSGGSTGGTRSPRSDPHPQIELLVKTDKEMGETLERVRATLRSNLRDRWAAPGRSPFGHTSKVDPKIVFPRIVKGLRERNIHYPTSEILVIGPPLDDSEIVAALEAFPAVQTIHVITPAPAEEITSRLIAPIEQRLQRQPQITTHFRFNRDTVLGLRHLLKPHSIGVVIINNVLDERTNYFSRGMVQHAYREIAEVLDPQGVVITGGALHTRPTAALWPEEEVPFTPVFTLSDTESLDYKYVFRLAGISESPSAEPSPSGDANRESLALSDVELKTLLAPLQVSDSAVIKPKRNDEKELYIEVEDAQKPILDLRLQRDPTSLANVKLVMTLLSEEAIHPRALPDVVAADIARKTTWFNAALVPLLKARKFQTIESLGVKREVSIALLQALQFNKLDPEDPLSKWIRRLSEDVGTPDPHSSRGVTFSGSAVAAVICIVLAFAISNWNTPTFQLPFDGIAGLFFWPGAGFQLQTIAIAVIPSFIRLLSHFMPGVKAAGNFYVAAAFINPLASMIPNEKVSFLAVSQEGQQLINDRLWRDFRKLSPWGQRLGYTLFILPFLFLHERPGHFSPLGGIPRLINEWIAYPLGLLPLIVAYANYVGTGSFQSSAFAFLGGLGFLGVLNWMYFPKKDNTSPPGRGANRQSA